MQNLVKMADENGEIAPQSKYSPELDKWARRLALLGNTNEEIAAVFDIESDTLRNWTKRHPSFARALKDGREFADAKVAASLFKRATGMRVPAVKIFNDMGIPLIVPYTEYLPPDVSAIKMWLRNRKTATWHEAMTLKAAVEAQLKDGEQSPVTIFNLPDNGREQPEDNED